MAEVKGGMKDLEEKRILPEDVGRAVSFVLDVQPVAKGRPKAALVGNRAILYTPSKTREYEEHVASIAREHTPVDGLFAGALRVWLRFYLKRPKSLPKRVLYNVKKPDIDNLIKSILDGLEGVIYKNDSQVIDLYSIKSYGDPPRVEVRIVEL